MHQNFNLERPGEMAVVFAFLYFKSVLDLTEQLDFLPGSDEEILKTRWVVLQNAV